MIYLIIILAVALFILIALNWLRKVQFDAVHRNLLDFEDHYGGRVIRGGFAVRPRYLGEYKGARFSISISAEKRQPGKPRQFYISIYLQTPAQSNYTVLAQNWIEKRQEGEKKKKTIRYIVDKTYLLEVSHKKILKNLNIPLIESLIKKMHPFAYILVSKKGLILERLSSNLIKDTEFEHLNPVVETMYELSLIPELESS